MITATPAAASDRCGRRRERRHYSNEGVELSYVDGKTVRPGYLLTDKLVQWNILTDELSTLVDFADAGVTPREIDMVSNASNTFEVVEMRCSGGSDPVEAVEWSGASSVAVGVDSNFLVTFKNLNAVVSVGRGAGAQLGVTSTK